MSFLRSVTVTSDQSSSTIDHAYQYDNLIDEDALDQSAINNQTTSKLRTFRGWKRTAMPLDKARLSKSLYQSNVIFCIFIISLSID